MWFTMFNVIAWLGLVGALGSGRSNGCFNEALTSVMEMVMIDTMQRLCYGQLQGIGVEADPE